MAKLQNIVIGIPVYNEERRLPSLLKSLVPNLENLRQAGYNPRVIACLNGTTDRSGEILHEFNALNPEHSLSIIHSAKGKFIAQTEMAKMAGSNPFLSVDSDLKLYPDCFLELVKHMENNPAAHVVYPNRDRFISGKIPDTPFLRMQRAYYYGERVRLPERAYFAGGVFLIRDTRFFLEDKQLRMRMDRFKTDSPMEDNTSFFFQQLGVDRGDLCDDVYLSRRTLQEYGADSIQKVSKPLFMYTPCLTARDFVNQSIRYSLARQCFVGLFPEFVNVENRSASIERRLQNKKGMPLTTEEQLVLQRSRIANCIEQLVTTNPVGMLKNRGYWTTTQSTKLAYEDYNAATLEVLGHRSSPQISVEYSDNIKDEDRSLPVTSSMGLLFNDKKQILTVFNVRGFDLPGGHIEKGETSLKALHREVVEEAGISFNQIKPMGYMLLSEKGKKKSVLAIYAGRIDGSPELDSMPLSDEIAGRAWMELEDFLILHETPGTEILKIVGKKAQQQLFPHESNSATTPKRSQTEYSNLIIA